MKRSLHNAQSRSRRSKETALGLLLVTLACATSCQSTGKVDASLLGKYSPVRLDADLSHLSAKERLMLPLLVEAGEAMDAIFWKQAYGSREELLASVDDPALRRFCEINYGPWDRLDGNAAFLSGVGEKPKGANFYPADMTRSEFEEHLAAHPDDKERFESLYTLVERTENGALAAVPYHEAYADELTRAAEKLRAAAKLAEDAGLARYLKLRADALLSGEYRASDVAWMDMKSNRIDVVIGPIENYEDQLFNYKAAAECYVLVKDIEWSARLARYAELLPGLQRGLPVPDEYKKERPGSKSDLNAYDVIYYSGDCNAGSKTIAINLPNDPTVQLEKGTRRLQLKNAMRAKFDRILEPLAGILIAADQRKHITFDAFFGNTMFHEVAHGLGIKNTLDGLGTVRSQLREESSALEEGKADVLGLYMVSKLREQGEIQEGELMDNYVTFLAGIFRSVRFGASSAHGRANMLRFNFFRDMGAFSRDASTGTYRVDPVRMNEAIEALSRKILVLQGDGDYDGVKKIMAELGLVTPQLQEDLDRLSSAGIPVDIVFEPRVTAL